MGCCASKPNPSSIRQTQNPHPQSEPRSVNITKSLSAEIAKKEGKAPEEKLGFKKKEVFVIHHRKSHDKRSDPKGPSSDSDGSAQPPNFPDPEITNPKTQVIASNIMGMAASGAAVRTSSCTKEEVDAILIQCGRLSRSSSGNCPISGSARKYSGSKRSHDFDRENDISTELNCVTNGVDDDERQMRRQSRGSHRRRTPSRSRERDPSAQRSGSRERLGTTSGSGSRRVSRSPGRRSDSPVPNSGNLGNSANSTVSTNTSNTNGGIKPGKMISVPATVSLEKNNNGASTVKRVLVRRNVGGEGLAGNRGNTPPRSRSPAARSNGGDAIGVKISEEGSSSQASLSRNSSRKAERSPYRRTPLNEVDTNTLPFQPLANRVNCVKGQRKSNEIEEVNVVSQDKLGVDVSNVNDEAVDPTILTAPETMKLPLTLTRSRSSRRSRDLEINVEALLSPSPATNYNLLLLQDIQNFHQKTNGNAVSDANSTPVAKTPFSLPECLSKVSSIVEAVADLNSSTKPNLSFTGTDDRQRNFSYATNLVDGKNKVEKSKVPFMESEVNGEDPAASMHKYVTVRKRGSDFESFQGGDFDELESSGSNSYTSGSRHHCISSSSWEPNSADSTDRWTSISREGVKPVILEGSAFSKAGSEIHEDSERKLSSNRGREFSDQQQRRPVRSAGGAGR